MAHNKSRKQQHGNILVNIYGEAIRDVFHAELKRTGKTWTPVTIYPDPRVAKNSTFQKSTSTRNVPPAIVLNMETARNMLSLLLANMETRSWNTSMKLGKWKRKKELSAVSQKSKSKKSLKNTKR